ncbi:helix-turn-helix domain-containing protein [Streptomyces thinghirensis]|nr:helix-turn-helix domain-containing protein [Streptomyces thinghirensis]
MAGDDFAVLLRELKERSGLSYGALGKRLHMSASTLHRYVSGEVVPTEFAPVERLARVCRATPEELLELHRRWIRARAARRKKEGAEERETEEKGEEEREEAAVSVAAENAPSATPAPTAPDAPTAPPTPAEPAPPRRRGPALRALRRDRRRRRQRCRGARGEPRVGHRRRRAARSAGAAEGTSASVSGTATTGSASPSASASSSPSGSASASGSGSPSASASAPRPGAATPSRRAPADGPVLTVSTTPYHWDVPCEHAFLIDRSPQNVPEPPAQQDAVGWATPLGAVSANRQMAVLTVQGTGAETVVLKDLHVRVVSSEPALDWKLVRDGQRLRRPGGHRVLRRLPRPGQPPGDAGLRTARLPVQRQRVRPRGVQGQRAHQRPRRQLVPGAGVVQRRPAGHRARRRPRQAVPHQRLPGQLLLCVPPRRRRLGAGRG